MSNSELAAVAGDLKVIGLWLLKIITTITGLRSWYRAYLSRLIKETHLFDVEYYLDRYRDIGPSGIDPLWHFAVAGDREGRFPMPIFDPEYYSTQAGFLAGKVNRLLHYAWVGRYRGFNPSPWFDPVYYNSTNPDVVADGGDPLLHYVAFGAREGRSPCENFDGNYYLTANPEVRESGGNPLYHYLQHGQFEGRKARASGEAGDMSPYQKWIREREAPELLALDAAAVQALWNAPPLISVVMPVYNTPEKYLRAAIESVKAQSYTNWELCIADDNSSDKRTGEVLRELGGTDARIRIAYRTENGHISAASNTALELANGEFVALLDHDDALPPHALFYLALALIENPEAQIVYSDEDKIDVDGRRFDPHFKPDWNPDLLLSINYVCHLGAYRRSLLEKIGGFRIGVEGSQDHDLLLRCLPHVASDQIIHIPRVLYHWRMIEGSTALASGEKSYTTDAGIRAIRDYFDSMDRCDVQVGVGLVPNTYRVKYPVPQPPPLVSLLIPTRDRIDLLEPCVQGILERTTYQNVEVLILDNQSTEPETSAFLEALCKRDRRVRVLSYDKPFNYSAINNFGVQQSVGQVIGLINNDVEVINPEWLAEMVAQVCRPEIGCVGAKLYYDDDTIQHAGVVLGIGGVAGHAHKYFPRSSSGYFGRLICTQDISAVTGACLLVRKEVYVRVGGLNERDLTVAFNDVDFCLRVQQLGLRNLWTPYAELYHHESKSRGAEDSPEKIARFKKEVAYMQQAWQGVLEHDRCYSPNLTLLHENFGLKES